MKVSLEILIQNVKFYFASSFFTYLHTAAVKTVILANTLINPVILYYSMRLVRLTKNRYM